jgi:hypothetical protein
MTSLPKRAIQDRKLIKLTVLELLVHHGGEGMAAGQLISWWPGTRAEKFTGRDEGKIEPPRTHISVTYFLQLSPTFYSSTTSK